MKRAVVLLSGGLDSATALAFALARGFECHALAFDYGQRHAIELDCARRVSLYHRVPLRVMRIPNVGGSALTDPKIDVPKSAEPGIPATYVPARNTIFLAFAVSLAEVLHAHAIFIGVNAIDFSGYPDCRPAFVEAFEHVANLATREGVEGCKLTIEAPLVNMTKAEIIATGLRLGVPYELTSSCYQGSRCGACDSCRIRAAGFAANGIADPACP